jgi:hypothetical protein
MNWYELPLKRQTIQDSATATPVIASRRADTRSQRAFAFGLARGVDEEIDDVVIYDIGAEAELRASNRVQSEMAP